MTDQATTPTTLNRVPMGATLGLFAFALVLSLIGFLVPSVDVTWHDVLQVVGLHVVLLPTALILVGMLMNRFGHQVYWRNAASLGWLLSCVWMLTKISQNG